MLLKTRLQELVKMHETELQWNEQTELGLTGQINLLHVFARFANNNSTCWICGKENKTIRLLNL